MARVPLSIEIAGRHCVCVGGGSVAARRARSLLDAGMTLTVIAPEVEESLQQLASTGALTITPRAYLQGDLEGAWLVLACTGRHEVDAAVAADAIGRSLLIVAAAYPFLGNCRFMAQVTRGELLVGIDTGGAAPAISAAVRRLVDDTLRDDTADLLEEVAAMRRQLLQSNQDPGDRAARWRRVSESGVLEGALRGSIPIESAIAAIRELLYT